MSGLELLGKWDESRGWESAGGLTLNWQKNAKESQAQTLGSEEGGNRRAGLLGLREVGSAVPGLRQEGLGS